jgi:hypothetical protein
VNVWRGLKGLTGILIAAGGVAGASGQTVTYLTPTTHTAALGQQVAVHIEAGEEALVSRVGWPTEKIDWLFVRAPGTQTNRENVGPAEPNGDFINVTLTKPGVTLVGLDTKSAVTAVPGQQFTGFILRTAPPERAKESVAAVGDASQVRVRRIESAKALVRVTEAGVPPRGTRVSHSAVAQSKTGQAVEIQPLADPTTVAVGSDLPVRAYVLGDKEVGVKVLATSVATGQVKSAITDSSGSCHFRIDAAGVWRIEFHQLKPLHGDPDADWAIYSATLTFEVVDTGAGK